MELTLSKPIRLKCGLELPNRLVKSAMAECLGNVQVDPDHLGDPHDFAVNSTLPEATTLAAFTAWSKACSNGGKCHALVQLCHPGRQIAFGKGTVAPSAIPMDFGTGLMPRLLNSFVFGTPRAMTVAEIHTTIQNFANAARLIAAAGFAGVELHAAHGYLLAQFLSPQSNVRTDAYGGSAQSRARIVVEVIRAVREAVPPGFCVGLKLNSVDVGSAAGMADCIEQIRVILEAGIDFLEISGGSFEDPLFNTGPGADAKKASTVAREAFFMEFAEAVRAQFPHVPLMVTGGFRSRQGMEAALKDNSCDLIGVARPAVMNPLLPRTLILNSETRQKDAVQHVKRIPPGKAAQYLGIKLLGVAPERDWYTKQIKLIGSTPSDSSLTKQWRRVAQIISFAVLVALCLWLNKFRFFGWS